MTLHEQIKGEIKAAMLAKDTVRLSVVRNMLSAFTNELVATGKTPQDQIPDADALKVVKRLANQRKDSIEQFEKGGRPELAASERAELTILETYLPALMSREEIKKIALAKKEALGVTDKAKAGQLTGAIMKDLAGKADGGDVKAVVDELFAEK
ncbi:MAG: GatB/Yqey domain protein [Parcubacteria group bacterium GW2011_GWA1_47_8]|nr:MAG: GatB/Yqey domain protein [Parcubacteria group bacterium GW2011_GWA1_47_8]KKW07138.1 MAG: GatB/Yqey domain protein [Parcubacteria group bacterium GW2011_GWA2_49_16]